LHLFLRLGRLPLLPGNDWVLNQTLLCLCFALGLCRREDTPKTCLNQTDCLDLCMMMLLLPVQRAPIGFLDSRCRFVALPLLPLLAAQIQDMLSSLETPKACLDMRGCLFR
jgi:hypothetical protein